jgi:hypothetical protein
MTAPATANAWFLPFGPPTVNGSAWHVPACDVNYDPPLCSTRYHDLDQTPGHPRGDGDCTAAPCDCGGVPCGEYLWDHRAPGLQQYLLDTVILNDKTGLGNPNIHGFYLDDGWTNYSAPVRLRGGGAP